MKFSVIYIWLFLACIIVPSISACSAIPCFFTCIVKGKTGRCQSGECVCRSMG